MKSFIKKVFTGMAISLAALAVANTAPQGSFLYNLTTLEAKAAGLSTPLIQAAVYQGNGQVLLSWSKVSGASEYEVYYSATGNSGTFSYLGKTARTTATVTVQDGGTAYLAVRALGNGSKSDYSKITSCSTKKVKPDIPNTFAWTLKGDGALIGWNAVKNCSGYDIYYRQYGEKEWKLCAENISSVQCGYHIKSVPDGVTFEIAVVSFNQYGSEKVLSDNNIVKITGGEPINCVGMMMDDCVNLANTYGVKVSYWYYDKNRNEKEILCKNNFRVKKQYVQGNTLYLEGERVSYTGITESIKEVNAKWTNLKNSWGIAKNKVGSFIDYFK